MPVFIISGNIGCGKSTVCQKLQGMGYFVFTEAVEEWEFSLKKFYQAASFEEKCQALFLLQLLISTHFIRVMVQIEQIFSSNPNQVVFVERSPLDALKVFI